jgi:membrane protein
LRDDVLLLKTKLRTSVAVVRFAIDGFARDNASLLGAGVAFWATLSLAPALVLLVVLAGIAYDAAAVRDVLLDWLNENVGGPAASSIVDLLEQASAPGALTLPGLVSVAVMAWAASRWCRALQLALNQIWEAQGSRAGTLGRRVVGAVYKQALTFLLLVSLGVLLLLSLIVGALLPLVERVFAHLPGEWYFFRTIELALSSVFLCVGVALVYMILPGLRVPWRYVWRGALITGTLLVLGKLALSFYLVRQNMTSFGAAGSVTALLLWVYYSTLVFLFGAELTQAYVRLVAAPAEPASSGAVLSVRPRSSWPEAGKEPPATPPDGGAPRN